jgi:elongation factor 3
LGALATAINEFKGGVIIISHNSEFTTALSTETWHVNQGRIMSMEKNGKAVVAEEENDEGSLANLSAANGSNISLDTKDSDSLVGMSRTASMESTGSKKKKTLTRKQLKERKVKKRLAWLANEE